MPRPCPACGRPNSDQAARCLYCTEPFGPTPPGRQTVADPHPPPRSVAERHLIILAPRRDADGFESKVEPFAEVVGLSAYDARLALTTRRYRLLCKAHNGERAREVSGRLQELGIAHFDIAESHVDAIPVVAMRRLRLEDGYMELELHEEPPLRMEYRHSVLLVRGEIKRERYRERRMTTPKGASQPLTPVSRLHIYSAGTAAAHELDPERFDWSVLGDEQTRSTPFNLQRLTDAILSRAGRAELDRGFEWEPAVLSRSAAVSEVDAVLGGKGSREGMLYDNETQFRYYSRWRFLVARAEEDRASPPG